MLLEPHKICLDSSPKAQVRLWVSELEVLASPHPPLSHGHLRGQELGFIYLGIFLGVPRRPRERSKLIVRSNSFGPIKVTEILDKQHLLKGCM